MLTLSAEQVRTLAPDASAARSGEALGNPRRWTAAGRSDSAAWGLCQGSGSSPYQVAVDIGGPAYKCSCPSRKIPCKHALGLLFLLADAGAPTNDPPDWVREWLDGRAGRAAAAATRAERSAEVDPEARARRVASREHKIAGGIEELDRWLRDLIRRGLDSTRGEGYRFWDTMGARLVDAQAAGLGRSVRGLGAAANSGDDWPHLLLEGAGRLHLLTTAYRRADRLPADLQADVRSLVGWTVKEDELDPANAVEDRWLVIGRRVDDRGDLVTSRTVLLGEASGRVALHLAFGVGAAPPTVLALPGQAFRATLTFYPSSTPLRAAVQLPIVPDGELTELRGAVSLADVVADHAARLARNPFVGAWPVVIGGVVPVVRGGRLIVRDAEGMSLRLADPDLGPRLLAVSGGHPITLVAEWDGSWLRPLASMAEGHLAQMAFNGEIPAPRVDDPEWAELLSAALLGTERTGGSVAAPRSVASLAAGAEPEGAILSAAAGLTVRRRAGATPTLDAGPLPPASPPEPRPILTGPPARHVGLAFTERPALVPEALALVRLSGRRLPDEWLPDLLGLAKRTDGEALPLADIGGTRAAWLAAVVPELASGESWTLDAHPDEALAQAETRAARAGLIKRWRRDDPDGARQWIERSWPELPGDDRAGIIGAMETGLGPADEPFLSAVLGEPRADVRRSAAQLLAWLPGSSFSRRIENEARPLLTRSGLRGRNLSVALPTSSAELEALIPHGPPASGYGDRAWLLRTLIGNVRPERWSQWLGMDPAGLIDRAVRSEEPRALLEGWILATRGFADLGWATALLRDPAVTTNVMLRIGLVLEGLSPADRAVAVIAAAQDIEPMWLAELVRSVPAPWPPELADALLAAAARVGPEPMMAATIHALVRAGAIGLPPERADDLEKVASVDGEIRPALIDAIDTIQFRARMYDAFAAVPRVQPVQP